MKKNKNDSKNIQKALYKSKGTIFFAIKKFTTLTSNHVVFNEKGFKGGVRTFLGLSNYHTKYDNIKNKEHLFIAGYQLLDFTLNFNPFNNILIIIMFII